MDVKISGHDNRYDVTTTAMLFFPGEKINFVQKSRAPLRSVSRLKKTGDKAICFTRVVVNGIAYSAKVTADDDDRNLVKRSFYKACVKATGITPPWGTLTGVRPLSVYERLKREGKDPEKVLKTEYYLNDSKIALLKSVSQNQRDIAVYDPKDVSVYISIPFCPGRCSYCSFISVSAVNADRLLDCYLVLLHQEIREKAELIKRFGLRLRSVYVGGGTPGILNESQLAALLDVIYDCFDITNDCEICFELGRPDTVTREKLAPLEDRGVDRVCINTQTTNDGVLAAVGRRHTGKDYFKAIELVKEFGFTVNTDLIAGLPGESLASFLKSVDDVIAVGVDNITVHTLAIKRSARLHEERAFDARGADVQKMIGNAYRRLDGAGYLPYYLYKQKNCVSNGENVGFCKPGTACKYNVFMMEDVHSVLACGAGASSKLVFGHRTQRVINVKYPTEYVSDNEKVRLNTGKLAEMLESEFCNG